MQDHSQIWATTLEIVISTRSNINSSINKIENGRNWNLLSKDENSITEWKIWQEKINWDKHHLLLLNPNKVVGKNRISSVCLNNLYEDAIDDINHTSFKICVINISEVKTKTCHKWIFYKVIILLKFISISHYTIHFYQLS